MAVTQTPPPPTVDHTNPNILRWDDIGLTLIHDFITESEEATMIAAFHSAEPNPQPNGKKRISQHFGYHFDYTTFGASETNFTPVPKYITDFLPRLPIQHYLPDQFTVQYYSPGTGIPPHVDTHSMFGEALYSLSFGSAVPMLFRVSGPNDARKMRLPKRSVAAPAQQCASGTAETTPGASPLPPVGGEEQSQKGEDRAEEQAHPAWELLLPPRSLLLMTGASRYGYTHGIRPRKTDVIDGRTVQRQGRYSVTMRTVRRGDEIGCECEYPGVCDARIREEMTVMSGGE
ncbi:Alkylated DNA repair protein alkB 8 [Madurella mycetomatis]|uniref:Alkylated DNA repair protein alkB 8 n=1 Tax=Madurella mycetomatis TaxID=100816 RepID=A0A175W208_9PEZI|nr:Alkylated DNA repair protein alkB 8 [Madurella mycetomatis]